MSKLVGKNIRIKDELYMVKAESKDGQNLILRKTEAKPDMKSSKKKGKKSKESITFNFGTLAGKTVVCKKKLKTGSQLGYNDYLDIKYPDDMMKKAFEMLKEQIGDKVPVSFFDASIADGKIIHVTVDTVALHPKKKNRIIVKENDGTTTNLPIDELLVSMLFDQECLAVTEIFESDCKKTSNVDEVVNDSPDVNGLLEGLSDVLGDILKDIEGKSSRGKSSKGNPLDSLDLDGMPSELKAILGSLLK